MDPQKLASLDPKLRDAYQRVMGTTIPHPQAAPVQAQTPPIPTPTPPMPDPTPAPTPTIEEPSVDPTPPTQPPASEPQPISTPEPSMPEPPVSQPQPTIPQPEPFPTPEPAISPEPPVQPSNFVQMNSEMPAAPAANTPNFTTPVQTQTIAIKKKSGMMIPVLFGILGLVFIAIYTLFWTKIFNFKLPFLP